MIFKNIFRKQDAERNFKKEAIIITFGLIVLVIVILILFYLFVFKIDFNKELHKEVKSNKNYQINTKQNKIKNNNKIIKQEIKEEIKQASTTKWRCLKKNEIAESQIKDDGIVGAEAIIIVKNKDTHEILKEFKINNILHIYQPTKIRKCGIYVSKLINYDVNKIKQKPNSRGELWKYDYNGNSQKILTLDEKDENGKYISYYSSDFRVSPDEKYISLIHGYMYGDDFSLIIKDLNTKKDAFVLYYNDLAPKINSQLPGIFNFRDWTKDSRYFWFAITAGANLFAYARIDTKDWSYTVYDVPDGQMGGEKLNLETGWVTHHTDLVWVGIYDIVEEIKKERREQGIGTKLYIYNLFTKEKKLVYETNEPLWFSKPKWLSDIELEYTLPSGEKKVYIIK